MKSKKTTLVVIGMLTTLGVAQKFYTLQSRSQNGLIELSSNGINDNSSKKEIQQYDSSTKLVEAMVHEAGNKHIIIVNNIGFSAAEYRDKDLLVKLVQKELMEKAEFLFKEHKGGVIEIVAGGTPEGVGRVIGAAIDQAFVNELSKRNVTIKTNGIVSPQVGEWIDQRLDRAAVTKDPNSTWEAMNEKGFRSVPELNTAAIENSFKENSKIVIAPLYVREGGAIGMKEALSYIMEVNRLAMELGKPVDEVAKRGPLVLQIGLEAGNSPIEMANNKGPKAATQILYALSQMASESKEFARLITQMNIQVEFISKADSAEVENREKNEVIKRDQFVINSERELQQKAAKAVNTFYFSRRHIVNQFVENALEILKNDNKLTPEEVEKKMGILTNDESKAKGKEYKNLMTELGALETEAQKEAQQERITLVKNEIARSFDYKNTVVGYRDALPTLLSEMEYLKQIYSEMEGKEVAQQKSNSIRSLVTTLENAINEAKSNAEKNNIVFENGKVRAKTIAERAIEAAKKR